MIHVAAGFGKDGLVALMLDAGINVHSEDRHENIALHEAVSTGLLEVANLLLPRGACVDAASLRKIPPPFLAASGCSLDLLCLVLKKG